MATPERGPLPAGTSVLVVEDEALLAINLESMLETLGCRVIGPVTSVERASELAGGGTSASVAILDVNVGGQPVFPVVEMLEALGVPFLFTTGFDRAAIPERWHDRPFLAKPYTVDQIADGLIAALNWRAAPVAQGAR